MFMLTVQYLNTTIVTCHSCIFIVLHFELAYIFSIQLIQLSL